MESKILSVLFTLLVGCCFQSTSLQAQEKQVITLKQAVDLGVKNSHLLKSSHAKMDEARAAVKEAKERRLPDVSIQGSYLHLNSPDIDLKVKKDPAAGTSNTEPPKVSQAAYGLVNLSVPVFSGLRLQNGIRSAKLQEQAVQMDAENDQEDVIMHTVRAYTDLYKARAAVELVKESLKQARQRVTDFSNLEKNGLLARNDLLKAELQVSNTELSLIDAENNVKLSEVNLKLLLGLQDGTVILPDSASFTLSPETKTISDWEQLAMQNRKDLSAIGLRGEAAEKVVKSVKGEYYPGLAFTGGYIAANIPNLLTVTNAVNVGLGVQYNLGSIWKTKSKIQQATARVVQLKAGEEQLSDDIRLQVNQSYQNFLLSQKKTGVYEKAVLQAMENYRIVKNKYDNSLVTTNDLLEADVAQLQAKLNFAYSKADVFVAYQALLKTTGLLKI
jgi:outer membrane protein TolC